MQKLSKLFRKILPGVLGLSMAAVMVVTGCSTPTTITATATKTTNSTEVVTTTSFNTATAVVTTTNTAIVTTTAPPTTIVTTTTLPPVSQATSLSGSGATFPQPLYSQWFSEYNTLTGVKINYNGVGSGAGINAITSGTVDFGASDALLTDTQLAAAQAAYGTLVTIPMTADAVCMVYNVAGITTGQLKLTGDVIAGIYLGTITKWNDYAITSLNPGLTLPSASIITVHRSDSSGTTNIYTNYLAKVSPTWVATIGGTGFATSITWPTDAKGTGVGASGNAGVAGAVQSTPNSIGYVGLAYAIQSNIPFAQVKNSYGTYITPSVATATAAANGFTLPDDMRIMITNSAEPTAYPITGFTWLLVYLNQTDQAKGKAIVNFLWWAIHTGQADCPALNYVQLSSAAVLKAEVLVKSIKFQGVSLYGS
jgi:phosphate transport system substrate-binding protein